MAVQDPIIPADQHGRARRFPVIIGFVDGDHGATNQMPKDKYPLFWSQEGAIESPDGMMDGAGKETSRKKFFQGTLSRYFRASEVFPMCSFEVHDFSCAPCGASYPFLGEPRMERD